MMKIGYARVSTEEQHLDQQVEALKAVGCEMIYMEKVSGAKSKRPKLEEMKNNLRPGDEVHVWKLDRLGRSIIDLIDTVTVWQENDISFYSVTDNLQFNKSSGGNLIFHVMAAVAQFERDIISERTRAGLARARKQGRIGGRPKGLSKKAQKIAAATAGLYLQGDMSITEIAQHLNIARSTIYNYLDYMNVKYEKRSKKRKKKAQKATN